MPKASPFDSPGDIEAPSTKLASLVANGSRTDSRALQQSPSLIYLSNIESIPQSRRVVIDIKNISAHVPDLFGQPTLWDRIRNPRKAFTSSDSSGAAVKGSFRAPKTTQILNDISGCVHPGEILALMGPSGSGKTTLLSIIGKRAQKSMIVSGQILFNGKPLDKTMKRKIGYVMQDDLLYESLTVYETLYYAAMLRLPREMSKQEKIERVEAVIAALGLTKARDTIIGGFFRRGISGGERKRTSVGHELLINPACLLLDEPTSGLDSTTAMHLLQTLRTLASGGRVIITTIHQPSSRLYMQLDKLLLLSSGHMLYYGTTQHAVDYFTHIGYPIPPQTNTADFILDLASGEIPSEEGNGEIERKYLISVTEAFLQRRPKDGFDADADSEGVAILQSLVESMKVKSSIDHLEKFGYQETSGRMKKASKAISDSASPSLSSCTPTSASGSPRERTSVEYPPAATAAALGGRVDHEETDRHLSFPKVEANARNDFANNADDYDDGDHRWGAPYWTQVSLLFQRSLRTRRFQSLSIQDFSQFLIIAVLAGLFWLQRGQEKTLLGSRDILGVLFFMVMFLSFRSLFVSLFTFPEEQRHMLKERASGLYKLSAFYIARLLSDFPMDLSIPTGFIIIVYFMAGLRYNAAAFFGIYGTLLLSMFVAQGLGLLLGSWFMNPKTAQTVAAVLMLTIVLTGGFFVLDIPPWIGWIKWLSYIYYSLGLLLYIQFDGGNTDLYKCSTFNSTQGQCIQYKTSSPETDPSCMRVTDFKTSLNLLQDPSSQGDAIRDGMVLLGFMIVLRIAVYYVLRRKTSGL